MYTGPCVTLPGPREVDWSDTRAEQGPWTNEADDQGGLRDRVGLSTPTVFPIDGVAHTCLNSLAPISRRLHPRRKGTADSEEEEWEWDARYHPGWTGGRRGEEGRIGDGWPGPGVVFFAVAAATRMRAGKEEE